MRLRSSRTSSTRAPACTTRRTAPARLPCTWLPATRAPTRPSACWRPVRTPTYRTTWAAPRCTRPCLPTRRASSRWAATHVPFCAPSPAFPPSWSGPRALIPSLARAGAVGIPPPPRTFAPGGGVRPGKVPNPLCRPLGAARLVTIAGEACRGRASSPSPKTGPSPVPAPPGPHALPALAGGIDCLWRWGEGLEAAACCLQAAVEGRGPLALLGFQDEDGLGMWVPGSLGSIPGRSSF